MDIFRISMQRHFEQSSEPTSSNKLHSIVDETIHMQFPISFIIQLLKEQYSTEYLINALQTYHNYLT